MDQSDKINYLRGAIKHARRKETTESEARKMEAIEREIKEDEMSKFRSIKSKNKEVFLGNNFLGDASDTYWTTEKLVIADDYLKQGRTKESYALLGNALEKFDNYANKGFPSSNNCEQEKASAENVYKAIQSRALRGSKKVSKTNPELSKELLDLAKEAEQKNKSMRERLEKSDFLPLN